VDWADLADTKLVPQARHTTRLPVTVTTEAQVSLTITEILDAVVGEAITAIKGSWRSHHFPVDGMFTVTSYFFSRPALFFLELVSPSSLYLLRGGMPGSKKFLYCTVVFCHLSYAIIQRVISTLDEGSSVSSPPGFDMLRWDMLMILYSTEKMRGIFPFLCYH
jgi:hypothetical protein